MSGGAPRLWVIAGPNGAGKSSLVGARLARSLPIVNPDDIARDLGPAGGVARAGRQAIFDRVNMMMQRRSFGIETTMSGAGVLRFMSRAKAEGYRLMLIYIGLDRPQLSLMRVAERVNDGGHNVPGVDIARRYPASLANLGAALAKSERAWVLDNSGPRRRMLLSRDHGQVRYVTHDLPDWATSHMPDRLRRSADANHIK
jgi:predicted ABC-type ATPase